MWVWFLEGVGVCDCMCGRVRDPQMKPTLCTWLYAVDRAHSYCTDLQGCSSIVQKK